MRVSAPCRLLLAPLFNICARMSSSSQTSAVATTARPTQRVLSIQSHTVHGFVGNKAATFPLQCLGFNVDAINTISLSNHPDYTGGCKGKSLNAEDVLAIVDGLDANNLLKYDLIITGYTRSLEVALETATAVKRVLAANPRAIYVLDPVLGDDGKFYVPSELSDFFRLELLPLAVAITPNHFEAEVLSGIKITSLASAEAACNILHGLGPRICILKGLQFSDDYGNTDDGEKRLSVILSVAGEGNKGTSLRIDVPKIEGKFSGCGDLFTAMCGGILSKCATDKDFSGHFKWSVTELAAMLEQTLEVMNEVVSSTKQSGNRELRIVESIGTYGKVASFHSPAQAAAVRTYPDFPSAYVTSGAVQGVIFDMDGTLTEPGAISYDLMYSRTGLTRAGGDIMTQINSNPDPARRAEQSRIIIEEEMLACERVICRSDVQPLLAALHDSRIRAAISTKNCEQAVLKFFEIAAIPDNRFAPLVTRDTLGVPSKPDPKVAEHILKTWDSAAGTVWFVGDSIDDMVCGKLAGCQTCLILTDDNQSVSLETEYVDISVSSLREFGLHIGLDL